MKADNPAVYECKGNASASHVHWWKRTSDGGASCLNCTVRLTRSQADDVFYRASDYEAKA